MSTGRAQGRHGTLWVWSVVALGFLALACDRLPVGNPEPFSPKALRIPFHVTLLGVGERPQAMEGGVYMLGAGGMLCVSYKGLDGYYDIDRLVYDQGATVTCQGMYKDRFRPRAVKLLKRPDGSVIKYCECWAYMSDYIKVYGNRLERWLGHTRKISESRETLFRKLDPSMPRDLVMRRGFLHRVLHHLSELFGVRAPKVPDNPRQGTRAPLDSSGLFLGLVSRVENHMGFDTQNWDARDNLPYHEIMSRLLQRYGYIPSFDPESPQLQGFADDYMLELFRIHYRNRVHLGFRRGLLGLFGQKRPVVTGMPKAVQEQMEHILGVDFMGLWEHLQTQWGLEVESR